MRKRNLLLGVLLVLLIMGVQAAHAQQPLPISYGETVQGRLRDSSDYVFYIFSGSAGDRITIQLSSPNFDTYLELGDDQANLLVDNDDINSSNFNSQIDFQLPYSGNFLIGVSGYSGGEYTLTLINNSAPSNASQQQGGGSDEIIPISYGQTVTGTAIDIETPIVYGFSGLAGDFVTIEASSDSVDTYILLADANINYLADNDDISSDNLNSRIDFVLPANGEYLIGVFAYSSGPYTLTLYGGQGGTTPPVTQVSEQPIGDITSGEITDAQPFFEIPIPAVPEGARIIIDAVATSGDLDTYLGLFYGDTLVAENDDRQEGNTDSLIDYPQAQAGDYSAVVTRYGFETGATSGTFQVAIEVSGGGGIVGLPTDTTAAAPNPSASGYPALAAQAPAAWTVLVYMGADNDLEGALVNDVDEFEIAGGSTQTVRVVALLDRSPDFDDSNQNWTDVRIFEVGADRTGDGGTGGEIIPTLDTIETANLGEIDTGYVNNLTDFLVWGMTTYPAQHYAVILNDHGGAWTGTVLDFTSNYSILTIPDMKEAFRSALEAVGVPKFDVLINDACLMSSAEYLAAVSPFFNYVINSPEITLNPSFDMTVLAQTLNQKPDIDPVQLGAALIDKYMIDMDATAPDLSSVLGGIVTDMSKVPALTQAIEDFAAYVNQNPAAYATLLGQARSNTYTYSFFLPEDSYGPPTNIDVGHFMQMVIELSNDPGLTTAAQNVLSAIQAARAYSKGGADLSNFAQFYNIYFPANGADFQPNYFDESPLQNWAAMLRNYYGAVSPGVGARVRAGSPAPSLAPSAAPSTIPQVNITNIFPTDATSVTFPTFISMEVIGRNIAEGEFTVDQLQPDGSLVRLDTSSIVTEVVVNNVVDYVNQWEAGVDDFDFTWEATLPQVTDGTTTSFEMVVTKDGVSSLGGRYKAPGSEIWQDVTVIFNDEGSTESMIVAGGNTQALAPIQPAVGGEFQTFRNVVTPDGRVSPQPGTTFIWPEGGLTWANAPAPSGQYQLGFLVMAFGGATGFDSAAVTVNNDAVDTSLSGYVDNDWGFRLTYPAEWFSMSYFPDQQFLQAGNVEETEYMFVYPSDLTDLQAIAQETFDKYTITATTPFTPSSIAGKDALEVDFTYTTDAGTWLGKGFTVSLPEIPLGLFFTVETLNGQNLDTLYAILKNNLLFFDINAVRGADTGAWQYIYYLDSVRLPVPRDWGDESQDIGIWSYFAPGGDVNAGTFAAIAEVEGTDSNVILDSLLNQFVANQPGYSEQTRETYYGTNATWATAVYSTAGKAGRMQVTIADDGRAYALWTETTSAEAQTVMRQIFDPMLDGFKIFLQEG